MKGCIPASRYPTVLLQSHPANADPSMFVPQVKGEVLRERRTLYPNKIATVLDLVFKPIHARITGPDNQETTEIVVLVQAVPVLFNLAACATHVFLLWVWEWSTISRSLWAQIWLAGITSRPHDLTSSWLACRRRRRARRRRTALMRCSATPPSSPCSSLPKVRLHPSCSALSCASANNVRTGLPTLGTASPALTHGCPLCVLSLLCPLSAGGVLGVNLSAKTYYKCGGDDCTCLKLKDVRAIPVCVHSFRAGKARGHGRGGATCLFDHTSRAANISQQHLETASSR